MKNFTLIKFLLCLSIAVSLIACAAGNNNDIPTANISSVLNIIDDDISGIDWPDQTTVSLKNNITFSGQGVSIDGSEIHISKGGNYIFTGTLPNGSIIVDTSEPVNLTLNNASITNPNGPAINILSDQTTYITVVSDTDNYLVDGTNYTDLSLGGVLASKGSLIFQGNGALNINAQYKNGIVSQDSVTINNGNLSISSILDGIKADNSLIINGGTINISSSKNGLAGKNMVLNDGSIEITGSITAVSANENISVKGGTMNISDCNNGISSKGNITIGGGNLNLSTYSASLFSNHILTINNGNIHLEAADQVIRALGNIKINNGTVVILGNDPNQSVIACDDSLSITGGTVLIAGNTSNIHDQMHNLQHTVILNDLTADTPLHIESDTEKVLTFMPGQDYKYLIFSSPLLTADKVYTVYSGGKISDGVEFYGLYTDAAFSGGKALYTFSCDQITCDPGARLSPSVQK